MPSKVWAVGEEVLAPDFNTYVQQQVVAQYPTAAARGAGLTSPVRGQPSYVASGDVNEGQEFWDGAAWRKPWSMPWGIMGFGQSTSNVGGQQPTIDIVTTTIATTVANRRWRYLFLVNISNGGAANQITASITDAGNSPIQQAGYTIPAGASVVLQTMFIGVTGAGSNYTVKGRVGGTTPWGLAGSTSQISYIVVEDVGPSGVPT